MFIVSSVFTRMNLRSTKKRMTPNRISPNATRTMTTQAGRNGGPVCNSLKKNIYAEYKTKQQFVRNITIIMASDCSSTSQYQTSTFGLGEAHAQNNYEKMQQENKKKTVKIMKTIKFHEMLDAQRRLWMLSNCFCTSKDFLL